LDSTSRGSVRSSFSRRDPEYNLLRGALNFLYITDDTNKRCYKCSNITKDNFYLIQ
jgi:hypothetical protein